VRGPVKFHGVRSRELCRRKNTLPPRFQGRMKSKSQELRTVLGIRPRRTHYLDVLPIFLASGIQVI
jgi:hypothetical protein